MPGVVIHAMCMQTSGRKAVMSFQGASSSVPRNQWRSKLGGRVVGIDSLGMIRAASWWPRANASRVKAEPMKPVAPVRSIFIQDGIAKSEMLTTESQSHRETERIHS